MKKYIFIFALLYFINGAGYAQFQKPTVSFPSPNAASLGTYGEIPVSFYTGLPQISIPLWEVKNGNISVPISLSHHASGVRPDQHPGWVGTNWTLMAGGAITRRVNNFADETNCSGTQTLTARGYYYAPHDHVDNWYTTDRLIQMGLHGQQHLYDDKEPDEFSFNFLNFSGTFQRDAWGKWQVRSNQNIKVIFENDFYSPPIRPAGSVYVCFQQDSPNYPPTFGKFTLITTDGTRYIFGGETNAIEYTMPLFDPNPNYVTANTWYLSKIIDVEGNTTTFSYNRGEFIPNVSISFYQESLAFGMPGGIFRPGFNCMGTNGNASFPYSGQLVLPVYLSKIETSDQVVHFNSSISTELRYSEAYQPGGSEYVFYKHATNVASSNSPSYTIFPRTYWNFATQSYPNSIPTSNFPAVMNNFQWRALNSINISQKIFNPTTNASVNNIRNIHFQYNNNPNQRLFLLGLQIAPKASSYPYVNTTDGMGKYQFEYNDLASLPPYLADKCDHWGFYNGMHANTINGGDDTKRTPQFDYMVKGSLKKIIYPTGGHTEFVYEAHDYSKGVAVERWKPLLSYSPNTLYPYDYPKAGGLRIKKTIQYDGIDAANNIEKEYLYVKNYAPNATNLISSGILTSQIQYSWSDCRTFTSAKDGYVSRAVISSQNVLPMSDNSVGSAVTYSEVVEKLKDGSYNIYKYANYDTSNDHLDEAPLNNLTPTTTPYDKYTSKDYMRGHLLQQTTYNNLGKKLQQKNTYYTTNQEGYLRYMWAKGYGYTCDFGQSSWFHEGGAIKIYTTKLLPNSEENITYDPQNEHKSITTYTTYTYNQYAQPVEITKWHGVGNETIEKIRYVSDAGFPETGFLGCPLCGEDYEIGIAVAEMKNKYMIGNTIEKQTWIKQNNILRLAGGTLIKYKKFGSLVKVAEMSNIIGDGTSYELPLATCGGLYLSYSPKYNEKAAQRSFFTSYDDKGNLLQMHEENQPQVSYKWGYNQTLPIAKYVSSGIGYWDYHLNGFEEVPSSNMQLFPFISTEQARIGKKSLKTSSPYTFNIPSSGNYIVSYWIKKPNQDWVFVSLETTGGNVTIGENYPQYPVVYQYIDEVKIYPKGVLLTTYNYEPLIGMTSQTDPNEQTVYYEYDGLGRLIMVRDDKKNILKHIKYHYKGQPEQGN